MIATESMINHMIELRLSGMREHLPMRLKQAKNDDLSHEDFFSLLLQDENDYRRSAKIKRLLRTASFKQPAALEEFDHSHNRGVDKKQLRDLQTGHFIDEGINILLLGPTGVGKSFLATAIGNAACRQGYSTMFFRVNHLIEQFLLSRAKGSYLTFIKKLASCDLLILDDLGIKPLASEQYQDLFDVIDERGEDKSIIVTSQLPAENWNEAIPDPVTCEAITDRLASMAMKIIMKGSSYRPKRKRGGEKQLDNV